MHGKNNRHEGSFGHHVLWLELLIQNQPILCSREVHNQLFYATIAGLGLTGLISRVAIRLKKASDCVQVNKIHFQSLEELLLYMTVKGIDAEYQMAWIDLLHPSKRSILSQAQHVPSQNLPSPYPYRLPKLPFCLLHRYNMSWINQWIFKSTKNEALVTLTHYNNPLDQIRNWNGLYGPRGFIQFQAVFDRDEGLHILNQLLELIQFYKATPILCVLKLFTQEGEGLLSFCRPGFTLAIDFYNNPEARQAILAMNEYIVSVRGRIYLAKDLLLLPEQMQSMYGKLELFQDILTTYNSNMTSNLARRLRIVL